MFSEKVVTFVIIMVLSMDVKVITRHAPSNYGSLLQSIATVEVFHRLGHDCTIIDYQRSDERGLQATLTELRAKESWNRSALRRAVYVGLRWPTEQYVRRRFDRFRRNYLPMTRRYTNGHELETLRADLYVTGSDQVWGPIGASGYDPAYFLDFAHGRRMAFAASFGRENLDKQTAEAARHLLTRYDAVTVRETSAAEIIERWGLPSPTVVIDPTLMVPSSFWRSIMRPARGSEGKYILVYQIHNNPALDTYAEALARTTGLELRRVSPSVHQISRPGRLIFLPDPAEFLSCIDNAAIMVTDSFHGTCMAVSLATPFVTVIPVNGTGTRNRNLLTQLGLNDRIVAGTAAEAADAPAPLDFERVGARLEKLRQQTDSHIKNALSSL